MTIDPTEARLERALAGNAHCECGLLTAKRAFIIDRGPSGGPEALALLFADDSFLGYWYGHVQPLPTRQRFVALLVWSKRLINAANVPLLFRRFHYWTRVRLEYEPCTVQAGDDAYAEADGFSPAVACLERMIARFDIAKRWPDETGPYASSPVEMRILGVYGIEDHRDADGRYPPVPMQSPLRLVTGPP